MPQKKKKNPIIKYSIELFMIVVSASMFALAVKLFISPQKFVSGGVSGISLIIGRAIEIFFQGPNETVISGILYFIFNIPLMILAWRKLSLKFAILSSVHVVVTSLLTSLLPNNLIDILGLSSMLNKPLDCAIFAGILSGAGTALSFSVGGSGAGLDVISIYYSIRKQISIGKINSIVNGTIIALNTLIFFNHKVDMSNALYSLIYTFMGAIVVDTLYVGNKKTIVTVITDKGDEISKMIMANFYRGVTRWQGKGAYTGNSKDFLYIVATSYEAMEMNHAIHALDANSFVSLLPVTKVFGHFVNKNLH